MPELQHKIPFSLFIVLSLECSHVLLSEELTPAQRATAARRKALVPDLSVFPSLSLHRDLCILSSANEPACVISNVISQLN